MTLTYPQTAKALGICVSTLQKWVREGIIHKEDPSHWRSGFTKEEVERVQHLGIKPFDCTRETWDRDFFYRRDETTAYWCGFLLADGCLHIPKKTCGSPRLTLGLASKDESHVRRFANDVGLPPSAVHSYQNGSGVGSMVGMRDERFLEMLRPWGIAPRKTYEWIEPQIESELLGHYLRGFFDGDGTVWRGDPGYRSLKISGSVEGLSWTRKAIKRMGYPWRVHLNDKKQGRVWCNLQINGYWALDWAYHNWHGDSFLRLDRKWSLIEDYLDTADKIHHFPLIRNKEELLAALTIYRRVGGEQYSHLGKRIRRCAKKLGLELREGWSSITTHVAPKEGKE